MEHARPSPPPITIEGGPGWAIGSPDVVQGGDEVPPPPRRPWARTLGAAVAVAAGFAAGTVVADERTTQLAETDAGAVSLVLETDRPYPELASTADGRPAVAVPLAVRNTGPREIGLLEIELLGTGLRAEELDGQRVGPGRRYAVQLVRPVDCDEPVVPRLLGPLRVRATTDAGEREVELRVRPEGVSVADEFAGAACGRVPPERSLFVRESPTSVAGGQLRVPIEVAGASRDPVPLVGVRALSGLRVRAVLGEDGLPLPLPVVLPAGDYDEPRNPWEGRGPARDLVVVVEVVDCGALLALGDAQYPLLELEVDGATTGAVAYTPFGDPGALGRLSAAACRGGA